MKRPRSRTLTEAQEGLWFFQKLDPGNPILNTGQYLEILGPLDVDRFQAAVAQAVAESEALSLRFAGTPEGPRQWLAEPPVPGYADVSGEADPEAAARSAMQADSSTPCDLSRGVAAFTLYRLGPERFFWYERIHHLATDGYAMVLFTDRVARLYADPQAGPPLAPLERAFEEDAAWRASGRREEDGRWWREAMAGMPAVAGLAPGRAVSGPTFLRETRRLTPEALAPLLGLAARSGVGWADALTALTAAYCQRFTGTAEAVIGVPFMGRLGSKAARTPAMVMNVLPLRVAPDEDAPLPDWLGEVAQALAEGRRHGRYRSEQLRRDLGLVGGGRRLYGPLVNVQPFDTAPRIPGLEVRLHILGAGAVDDITFTFRGDPGAGLVFEVDANPALYDAAAVAGHSERLAAFLTAACAAERLADVPTVSPAEAGARRRDAAAADHPLPDTTLTALIEAQLAATPDAPALRFEGRTLSYAELDRRSAALARALVARGAGPDRIVAVAMERSLDLVISVVAILRAGAAYLPLDPAHPDERLARILSRAQPVAVLASPELAPRFAGALVPGALPDCGATPILPNPGDLAYVIFTSGSTGEPKGVMIEHRAIVNRLEWMRQHYGFTAADRILQKTPATFDVSVWEFFLPLICGATLVVAPPGAHRDPSAIARLIRDESVSTLHFVPSMLSAFLASPASDGLEIARTFCSGEELTPDQRDRFHRRVAGELHNLYGPTEAAVDVSYWPAGPEDRSAPVPIGWPVWNTRLEVLDDRFREVPDGVAGQLFLGGMQLARGYLGRPDLTADRFIPDPRRPGERLYATGDLARRRPDGAVVYLGRSDHQVKIRGLRIELGEIEAALMAFPALSEVAVVAREDGGTKRIIAYTVPQVDEAALRRHLAGLLPDYMIPSAIVPLAALPVTSNGKLDRAALPAPVFADAGGEAATQAEARMAEIFAEVLGLPRLPGPQGDFFALGGDSLSAVRLVLRIEAEFGRDPGLGAVFDRPTVAALAQAVEAGAEDHGLSPAIRLAEGRRPALVLIHPAGGIGWGYRGLATALPGREIWALQSPALDPAVPLPQTLDRLARDYVDRVLTLCPEGPWHLAGWSVGGIVAQAMAVEMRHRGLRPGLVALLDSYPADVWRDEPEPDEAQALRALLAVAGHDPEAHPELRSRAAITAFLRQGGSALGALPEPALDGVIRTVAGLNRLVRHHRHARYDGVLLHVTAALDHRESGLVPALWTPYAAQVDSLPVPFLHPQLTAPAAVARIAPALAAAMDEIEREAACA